MTKLTKEKLESIKKETLAQGGNKNWVKVGMSACGIAAGADEVLRTFVEEAKKRNIDVAVKKCGCQGMCFAEPMVEVRVEGLPIVTYGNVNKEIAIKIFDKHICNKILVRDHIFESRNIHE